MRCFVRVACSTFLACVVLTLISLSTYADSDINPVTTFSVSDEVVFLRFSRDGKLLLIGTDHLSRFGGGTVFVLSTESGKVEFTKAFRARVTAADLSPDGKHLAICSSRCEVLQLPSGTHVAQLEPSSNVVFANDTTLYHSARALRILDLRSGDKRNAFPDSTIPCSAFALTASLESAALVLDTSLRVEGESHNATFRIDVLRKDPRSPRVPTLEVKGYCPSVAWSPSANTLFVSGSPPDRRAMLWKCDSNKFVFLDCTFSVANGFISDELVACLGTYRDDHSPSLMVFNAETGRDLVKRPLESTGRASFSNDCRFVATTSKGKIRVYDIGDLIQTAVDGNAHD